MNKQAAGNSFHHRPEGEGDREHPRSLYGEANKHVSCNRQRYTPRTSSLSLFLLKHALDKDLFSASALSLFIKLRATSHFSLIRLSDDCIRASE